MPSRALVWPAANSRKSPPDGPVKMLVARRRQNATIEHQPADVRPSPLLGTPTMRPATLPSDLKSAIPLMTIRALALRFDWRSLALASIFLATSISPSLADENAAAERFREHVQPILESYCYGCHGYGASEGNRTLDEFE